jgi:hypothetical protein
MAWGSEQHRLDVEKLREALLRIRVLEAENARLRKLSAADRQRAELAEDAVRRAYAGFAQSAARR